MIKYYCDACGKEIEDRHYNIKLLCHIAESGDNSFTGHSKIVDGKFQPISGREVVKMLCLTCYNEVMFPLWDNIRKIQTRELKEGE